MVDEKLERDVVSSVQDLNRLKDLLDRLYYHPDFGTFTTRPIISMLVSACNYLSSNLEVLLSKYRSRAEGR
jgi:hypothetical protein